MGHFGFSYTGLLFLAALFIPNILWTRHIPTGYTAEHENKILQLCERTGEVLTCACVLCFSDYNIKSWSAWSLWLLAALLVMALYEYWWLRYFRSQKTQADFYSSLLGIPVAGASLPVIALFLLAVYGRVIWLFPAALLLGIGHIGIHLQHRNE